MGDIVRRTAARRRALYGRAGLRPISALGLGYPTRMSRFIPLPVQRVPETQIPQGGVSPARGWLPYVTGRSRLFTGGSSVEVKSFDQVLPITVCGMTAAVTGSEPAAAWTGMTEVNLVRQGAAFYNRIGSKISVRSIQVDADFIITPGKANVAQILRMMLVYDRQANGAFPAITDIIQNNDSGVATFFSGINIVNKSRFTIIRDKLIPMDYASGYEYPVHEFVKCNLEVEYKANGGTIGDITTGAIYMLLFVAYDDGGSSYPQVTNFANGTPRIRIRYFDN